MSESVRLHCTGYNNMEYTTHYTKKKLRFQIFYIYKKNQNNVPQQDNHTDIQVDIDWMTNGEMVSGIDQGHKSLPWLIILAFNK